MNYKALTLTPPWGTLIALGQKRIETRSWSTDYRGPLLIHQGSNLKPVGGEAGLWDICASDPFHDIIHRHCLPTALPRGAFVAICNLLDCVPTQRPGAANEPGKPWFIGARKGVGQHYYEVPPPLDSNEYAFGDYAPGRYAWLLADVRALPSPVAARGLPGLWTWEGEIEA